MGTQTEAERIATRERKAESLRRWRASNPEKALAQSRRADAKRVRDPKVRAAQDRAYHAAHREERNARSRAYHVVHREELAIQDAARYRRRLIENEAQVRADRAAVYMRDPEGGKRRAREWRLAHQDTPEYQQMKRRWRERNVESVRASQRAWKQRNPNQSTDDAQTRRARLHTAGPVERIRRQQVWERDRGICYLCDTPADPARWHLDHVTPIARGGTHTYDNVAVTHPACNLRKNRWLPDEYRARLAEQVAS